MWAFSLALGVPELVASPCWRNFDDSMRIAIGAYCCAGNEAERCFGDGDSPEKCCLHRFDCEHPAFLRIADALGRGEDPELDVWSYLYACPHADLAMALYSMHKDLRPVRAIAENMSMVARQNDSKRLFKVAERASTTPAPPVWAQALRMQTAEVFRTLQDLDHVVVNTYYATQVTSLVKTGGTILDAAEDESDQILRSIFERIGETNRFYVEIGTEWGEQCVTRSLRMRGWRGVMVDADYANPYIGLVRRFVEPDTVNQLLCDELGVPGIIDFLSIDIDGMDYHIWDALNCTYPRVLEIEYGAEYGTDFVQKYEHGFRWSTGRYGSGRRAIVELGAQKGYTQVTETETKLIFVSSAYDAQMAGFA